MKFSTYTRMTLRWLWFFLLPDLVCSCFFSSDKFLDPSIPRVVTPSEQIATVRTKWVNGKLLQTTFLDSQNRVLEDFMYGYTNQKILNQYAGNRCVSSTLYYHSDSSEKGYARLTKSRFDYDQQGRRIRARIDESGMDNSGSEHKDVSYMLVYQYTSANDTILSRQPALKPDSSTLAYVNRWERNGKEQIVRNYRLYVMKMPHESRPDTINYYSHRFSYDKLGRRNLAWYDIMYLGRFYIADGPDTIKYDYDDHNRVRREEHIYTLDRRNKREIDTTSLRKADRTSANRYRQQFFTGTRYLRNNEKTNIVEYRYEAFDSDKHLPLQISQDVGY